MSTTKTPKRPTAKAQPKAKPQPSPAPAPPQLLRTLSVTFGLRLRHHQLEAFRGAVADMACQLLPTGQASLFHNHNNGEVPGGNAYLYRYSRIQYRVHGGQVGIWAINEGAEAMAEMELLGAWRNFALGGEPLPLRITELRDSTAPLPAFAPAPMPYRMYRYLPLNSENYEVYKALEGMADRIHMLERLLANHLVGFGRQVGWQWEGDQQLQVRLRNIAQTRTVKVLGVPNIALDLDFTANALLPDRMALGRKTAFGFGWLHRLPK